VRRQMVEMQMVEHGREANGGKSNVGRANGGKGNCGQSNGYRAKGGEASVRKAKDFEKNGQGTLVDWTGKGHLHKDFKAHQKHTSAHLLYIWSSFVFKFLHYLTTHSPVCTAVLCACVGWGCIVGPDCIPAGASWRLQGSPTFFPYRLETRW
jgi:hypothetical protein